MNATMLNLEILKAGDLVGVVPAFGAYDEWKILPIEKADKIKLVVGGTAFSRRRNRALDAHEGSRYQTYLVTTAQAERHNAHVAREKVRHKLTNQLGDALDQVKMRLGTTDSLEHLRTAEGLLHALIELRKEAEG